MNFNPDRAAISPMMQAAAATAGAPASLPATPPSTPTALGSQFDVGTPSASNVTGPAPATHVSGDLTEVFNRIETMANDYSKAQKEFGDKAAARELVPGDGRFEAESRRLMDMMVGLQQVSQGYSMRVELISKVVEHATSSTKTLLQTQT